MLSDPVKRIPEVLFAFSITGIAGPQGGQPAKPVGTVCFAWAGPQGVRAEQRFFSGDRAEIQRQAAAWAMAGLFGELCRARAVGSKSFCRWQSGPPLFRMVLPLVTCFYIQ